VSLAFALALPGDAHAADEERDEAVLEAFLDLGIEYISSQSAEADEDHSPCSVSLWILAADSC
jgi:hypothetical protein